MFPQHTKRKLINSLPLLLYMCPSSRDLTINLHQNLGTMYPKPANAQASWKLLAFNCDLILLKKIQNTSIFNNIPRRLLLIHATSIINLQQLLRTMHPKSAHAQPQKLLCWAVLR